jgi:predicted metal-binding membrane protein
MNDNRSAFRVIVTRDTWTVGAALAALAALAWAYLFWVAAQMNAPSPAAIPDMIGMAAMMEPAFTPWTLTHTVFVFAMWAVMMVGMMAPSVAPTVLIYMQVARHARTLGESFASACWFSSGYFLAWILFALLATSVQYGLESAALLSPMMARTSGYFSGAILIAVGAYQFSPLKNICLSQCRAPLSFVQRHGGFQSSARGSLGLGMLHGFYCVGCCWTLMALLFVVGVMNVLWIAVLAILVLAEKMLPGGRYISACSGAAAISTGAWMLAA